MAIASCALKICRNGKWHRTDLVRNNTECSISCNQVRASHVKEKKTNDNYDLDDDNLKENGGC